MKTVFSPDDPPEAVVRRALGDPESGLTSAIPVQLRGAPKTVVLDGDGLLRIDIEWDFALTPDMNGIGVPGVDLPILDQIMATACQFDEVVAVEVSIFVEFGQPTECDGWEPYSVDR